MHKMGLAFQLRRGASCHAKQSAKHAGGFGTVYLGVLNKENVAFKIVNSNSDRQQERFIREITILRACSNAHIVQVIMPLVENISSGLSMSDRVLSVLTQHVVGSSMHVACSSLVPAFGRSRPLW